MCIRDRNRSFQLADSRIDRVAAPAFRFLSCLASWQIAKLDKTRHIASDNDATVITENFTAGLQAGRMF